VNENFNLALEVCGLEEIGYKLETHQRDLTIVQKLFLLYAYPVYQNEMERQSKNKNNNDNNQDLKVDPNWAKRQKQKREQRKR